jgi:RHS repeat-associated protein
VVDYQSFTDYYPFGMQMKERSFSSSSYRFGFNGQEKDDEVSGAGNIMTAEFWEYDSRLGRRWNTDPIDFAWISPYSVFRDNPILYIDKKGNTWDKTDGSDATIEKHKTYTNNKINDYKQDIQSNTAQINSLRGKLDQINSQQEINYPIQTMSSDGNSLAVEASNIQDKITQLENKNSELNAMVGTLKNHLSAIDEMTISPIVFSLRTVGRTGNLTTLAPTNTRVEIYFDGTHENLAHEVTHGHQFQTGREALPRFGSPNSFSPTWDIYDEIEAYSVEQAFDPSLFGSLSNVTAGAIISRYPIYSLAPSNQLTTESSLGEAAAHYRFEMMPALRNHGNITIQQYKAVHGDYRFNIK